jgi:hypothetical protein
MTFSGAGRMWRLAPSLLYIHGYSMTTSAAASLPKPAPPRVLIVMPDQWPRALLRAALREAGYDAIGARTLGSALRVPPLAPDRGVVRLVIVDQPALSGAGCDDALDRLLARHGAPATLLLARVTVEASHRQWQRVLRRPVSLADIVAAAAALLPLPPADHHPID